MPRDGSSALIAHLSIFKISRPAKTWHHTCEPIGMGKHETNRHLIEPVWWTNKEWDRGTCQRTHRQTSKSKKHHPDKSNPLPGIPEGQNRSSTGPVSSLVVVIIHKDQGSVRRHKSPAFSPVPKQKHRLEASLSIGVSSESWRSRSTFILTLSRPSFLHSTCGALSPVWHRTWILSLGHFQNTGCLWWALHPSQLPGIEKKTCIPSCLTKTSNVQNLAWFPALYWEESNYVFVLCRSTQCQYETWGTHVKTWLMKGKVKCIDNLLWRHF